MEKILAVSICALTCSLAHADSSTNAQAGIEKHITQICTAYHATEWRDSRRVVDATFEPKTQARDVVVLFAVWPRHANTFVQFVSVLRYNSGDTDNPEFIFLQKIGTRGEMFFDKMTEKNNEVFLIGTDHGPGDSMASPSLKCTLLLSYKNGILRLEKQPNGAQPTQIGTEGSTGNR